MANEANNAKFNFLKPGDPYHAYYQHKIKEISAAENGEEAPTAPAPTAAPMAPVPAPPTAAAAKPVLPPSKPVEPPEEEHYTAHIPEGLTLMDVDVIKLTAQFVARNGKSFLTGLASREHANPQFNFLKPTHSLFSFFTSLCDAYSRVLMPPKGLTAKLQRDVEDRSAPLQRALNRLEFERVRDKEAQQAADAEEAQRIAFQSIDWHDFVIVETITFADGEDAGLPLPVTLKDIMQAARSAQFQEAEAPAATGPGMDAEEQALVAQAAGGALPPPPMAAPADSGDVDMDVSDDEDATTMKVVKNYVRPDPRAAAAGAGGFDATKYVVSPITGELVPIQDMAEHMRVSLMDPKWKQQKDAMLSKIKETTKASDDEIGRNLTLLARRMPDVFGSGASAVTSAVGKQIEEQRKAGQTPAQGAGQGALPPPPGPPPPRPPPPLAAALPPPSAPPPVLPPPPGPPPAPGAQAPSEDEEQAAKRQKVDGS